jgi:DNA-binding response OmpR family regulator
VDGVELARRARRAAKFVGPIIVISGRVGARQERELAEAQVAAVIEKPFPPPTLLAAIDSCLTTAVTDRAPSAGAGGPLRSRARRS